MKVERFGDGWRVTVGRKTGDVFWPDGRGWWWGVKYGNRMHWAPVAHAPAWGAIADLARYIAP